MHSSGFCADMCFSAMKYNKDGKKNCENIYTNETVCDGEFGGVWRSRNKKKVSTFITEFKSAYIE